MRDKTDAAYRESLKKMFEEKQDWESVSVTCCQALQKVEEIRIMVKLSREQREQREKERERESRESRESREQRAEREKKNRSFFFRLDNMLYLGLAIDHFSFLFLFG